MLACDQLPERFNAAEWFIGRHAASGRGDRVAITTDDGDTTFGELDRLVRAFAAALESQGLHRGDRVAIVLPDGPLFAISFWGAVAAGAVAVPLNSLLKPEKLQAILADCDPRLLVFDANVVDGAAIATDGCAVWPSEEARRRVAETSPSPGYAATHRDGFAFFLYSSGTTGEPKGVVHLQHDPWICSRGYGEHVLRTRSEDRCFSIAKLFFAYGLGNAQYFPFDVGARAILFPGRPTPEAVFAQVRRHRPTLFFGVPTAYAQLLAAMDRGAAADFSSVRLCASAGEALPPSVFDRWRERTGLEIFDGIGSTEICHMFLSNRAGAVRAGSSGTPVPGYEVRITDESGRDAVTGEIGDLLVKGDSTMAFYWNKHEASKRTVKGDWIHTGDKYFRDADGFYWHAGRTDDMLKVGGQWVSPVEVEAALIAHPAVLECAVVGQEDGDGLTKPHAFVALRAEAGAEDLVRTLQAFAREKLEPFKCPRWVTFVPELPKTATGKIQRYLLRSKTSG
ncbi:MAG TPA: benzoate-CoA ligase family protein [Thermoanaerobaculia bacterium]